MAKAKTITHLLPVEEHSGDTARNEIALHAAGAVDSLLKMLRREAGADADGFSEVLTNTLIRLEALNAVSLSVLSGNDRDVDELCRTVYGQHSDGRLAHPH